jgi:putative glutamine amidotransferase
MLPNEQLRIAKAHLVALAVDGWLHRLTGVAELAVNSLHNQAIDRLGTGLVVDALAPDGTIEAVWAPHAPGYVVGVQWHPEFDLTDHVSHLIFADFGRAVRARAAGGRQAAMTLASAAE